jgi:hypothetical protein
MSSRKMIGAIALTAALAGGAGALLAAPTLAGAQSNGSTTTTVASNAPAAPNGYGQIPGVPTQGAPMQRGSFDPHKGGHVGANGTTEVLLTGTTADKVTAAAKAAVPGATVLRVENDAEGSPYEAHMQKSDGSQVTVKVDSNFSVTKVETGP